MVIPKPIEDDNASDDKDFESHKKRKSESEVILEAVTVIHGLVSRCKALENLIVTTNVSNVQPSFYNIHQCYVGY